MKHIDGRKVEDCFDGGLKYEYRLDGDIAETFMRQLAAGARLDFYPDFPKPFFWIFREDGLQIKGIPAVPTLRYNSPRIKRMKQRQGLKRNCNGLSN
jgi:hypothetical protein